MRSQWHSFHLSTITFLGEQQDTIDPEAAILAAGQMTENAKVLPANRRSTTFGSPTRSPGGQLLLSELLPVQSRLPRLFDVWRTRRGDHTRRLLQGRDCWRSLRFNRHDHRLGEVV
jgi:hypothetical protein